MSMYKSVIYDLLVQMVEEFPLKETYLLQSHCKRYQDSYINTEKHN